MTIYILYLHISYTIHGLIIYLEGFSTITKHILKQAIATTHLDRLRLEYNHVNLLICKLTLRKLKHRRRALRLIYLFKVVDGVGAGNTIRQMYTTRKTQAQNHSYAIK
jgi:hypothetical protein